MPEGPQVRALAARLRAGMLGRRLVALVAAEPTAETVDANAVLGTPQVFDFIVSRGKLLGLRAGTVHLLLHLRLSGEVVPEARAGAMLQIVTDAGTWSLIDVRRIAKWSIVDAAGAREAIAALGPDAATVTREAFAARVGGSGGAIGNVIVDQAVVAGVGNCMRSEILWRARIAPGRAANSLSATELGRLYESLGVVYAEQFRAATETGSLHAEGAMRVYKRKVDRDGAVVTKQKMGSLMVYWVSSRQS